MKRIAWVLIACLLLSVALVGCAGADEGKRSPEPSDDESVKATGEATGEAATADDAYPALTPETDGENEALSLAETTEGRTWASGNAQGGTPVQGDARLVGYSFRIHDGATQYQVRVMDGKIYGYVGGASDKALAGQYTSGWYDDPAPSTARQREAWDAALAEVAKVNANATQGGIESYIFLFPPTDGAAWSQVLVFADAQFRAEFSSNFAMGGSWYE